LQIAVALVAEVATAVRYLHRYGQRGIPRPRTNPGARCPSPDNDTSPMP